LIPLDFSYFFFVAMATKEKPSFATEITMPACRQTGHSRKSPLTLSNFIKNMII